MIYLFGDIVPVCKVGAILPDGLEIKKGNLRGVESNGMMCSCSELNIPLTLIGNQVEDRNNDIRS
ncbi:MAG: hypothetical protein HXK70_03460 [Clostridiales bacterium]|nr:hypothetical protein [Clostridiales bacterium]